jgi:NAD(P)-dependent dehydrogenase (short-subunit alcohol dehydrogenase family)
MNATRRPIAVVTGGTSGIGFVTARALAAQGARVLVVGRDAARAAAAVTDIKRATGNAAVEPLLADLSGQAEVRRLAAEIQGRVPRVDVLMNNAGAFFPRRAVSVDGIEMTFALNHLSYFLLTNLLLDTLRAGASARIVNTASVAHRRARIDFADLQAVEHRYFGWRAYAQSKLANLLFTYELARRLEGTGVTANAVHPGFVATNFGRSGGGIAALLWRALQIGAIDQERGAETLIYLASAAGVEGITGKYFVKERPVPSSAASYDRAAAQRLWLVSAQMVGL